MNIDDFTDTSLQVIDLRPQDLKDAAREGIVTDQQALALWQWLSHGGAQYRGTPRALSPNTPLPTAGTGPKFGFVNVLYYLGGMVAISAMSLFMTPPDLH